ncbi:MAG TPA: hypothetical protein VGD02_04225 [Gemmatimonadaceae bacterium]|jgi:hypothetical protein
MADNYSNDTLPRDVWRTVLASLIVLLTAGGWIYSLSRPEYRAALPAQTKLWWVEQLVSLALMVACIGVILRKRSFASAAFWLAAYALVFDLVRWFFEFEEVQIPVPVTVIIYALLMWRLRLTWRPRRVVETTPPPG